MPHASAVRRPHPMSSRDWLALIDGEPIRDQLGVLRRFYTERAALAWAEKVAGWML